MLGTRTLGVVAAALAAMSLISAQAPDPQQPAAPAPQQPAAPAPQQPAAPAPQQPSAPQAAAPQQPTAPQQPPAPQVQIGSLNMQNASLTEFIDQLARALHINISVDPAVKGGVTLNTYGDPRAIDARNLL